MSKPDDIVILEKLKETEHNYINPNTLYIHGMHSNDVWAVLIMLSNRGLIQLTKQSAQIKYEGKEYLRNYYLALELNPTINPKIQEATTHKENHQKGTWIIKLINNDWFKLIVTGLIVILVGTYILVRFKIIK